MPRITFWRDGDPRMAAAALKPETVRTRCACRPSSGAAEPRPCDHLVRRAERRSRSLDASGPHRKMNGTNATGLQCTQSSQTTQHQGVPRRSCSSVGLGGVGFMPQPSPDLLRRESRQGW
jgi:hypothetical protein